MTMTIEHALEKKRKKIVPLHCHCRVKILETFIIILYITLKKEISKKKKKQTVLIKIEEKCHCKRKGKRHEIFFKNFEIIA